MNEVLSIKNQLKAKQLLDAFDQNLKRLQEEGVDREGNESEAGTIDLLSEWLEEAIENGVEVDALQTRAKELAKFAFSRGYNQHEVEELLTMHPNPKSYCQIWCMRMLEIKRHIPFDPLVFQFSYRL